MALFAILFWLSIAVAFAAIFIGSIEFITNEYINWWRWLLVVVFWLAMAFGSFCAFGYMGGYLFKG
jgi:hypothetical protein